MYNVKDESVRVDTCESEALSVILNDPQIKADYEDEHKIDSELLDMKNEILNLINCNNLSSEKFNSKNDYSLSSQVDVNYSDYYKQDQESLKYAVKGIVFDIVDSLYFSAKEG